MYIDWIRIYQQGTASETFVCPTASDPIEPEQMSGIISVSGETNSAKILRDGRLYILRGEHEYSLDGRLIR